MAKGILAEQNPEMYEKLLDQMSANANTAAQGTGTLGRAQQTYAALVEGLESPEIAQGGGFSNIHLSGRIHHSAQ